VCYGKKELVVFTSKDAATKVLEDMPFFHATLSFDQSNRQKKFSGSRSRPI
jgi:hypothetical protein